MKQIVRIQHSFKLSFAEEQRLANAILKKYGKIHGKAGKVYHDAVMEWVERVEKENVI